MTETETKKKHHRPGSDGLSRWCRRMLDRMLEMAKRQEATRSASAHFCHHRFGLQVHATRYAKRERPKGQTLAKYV